MIELPEYVNVLLKNIAKSEGFLNYTSELNAGSKHGDNFLGVLTSVTIIGPRRINGTTTTDKLHLLCKLAPTNVARRAEFHSEEVFEREVFAYNKLLPLFADFQREKGLSKNECFNSYPKCYAAVANIEKGELVLIMEDLRPKRYEMWPKAIPFTAQHSFGVVEHLAKLHAISFALKDQRPDEYKKLRNLDDLLTNVFIKKGGMAKMMYMGHNKLIPALSNVQHKQIVHEIKTNMPELFEDCFRDGACDPFGVICHGDPWINNILFQCNEEKPEQIDDICLVDWQLIRFCSPVLDLHYNIFSSTDKAFRQKEYKNLMKHYHKTLSTSISRLGSDPEQLFPFVDFECHLKKFGKFAFLMGPIMVQMMVTDPKDIPNLDTIGESLANGDANTEFFQSLNAETQQIFNRRVDDLFSDLVELGYYWK